MAEFAIETDRLKLRAWRDGDREPLHALCNDREVMEFLGPPLDMAAVDAAIARQRGFQDQHGYCYWAVERKSDQRMLGFCGIMPGPVGVPHAGSPDIGWRLARDAWGQGYAREAAQSTLDWSWTHITDERIWAITVPANRRSWGLMERLGMVRMEDGDFDHPNVPDGSPIKRHISYYIDRV
jgi:RimJ/RimL family protein N-acetyltransferase